MAAHRVMMLVLVLVPWDCVACLAQETGSGISCACLHTRAP